MADNYGMRLYKVTHGYWEGYCFGTYESEALDIYADQLIEHGMSGCFSEQDEYSVFAGNCGLPLSTAGNFGMQEIGIANERIYDILWRKY